LTHDDLAKLLTIGCRILAEQQILDAYGHLSARIEDEPAHFMISRGISPALVEPADFIILDANGAVVWGNGHPNAEWPIHEAVYRARPDVNSVLHSHSRLSRIFSLSNRKLQGLLTTQAAEWQGGLPVYRGAGLITSRERGDVLASVLGNESAMLLRGHGDVVTGPSVTATVMKAITLKQNADVLHEVLSHGGDLELWSDEERAAWSGPRESISREAQAAMANRAWDYYEARVSGRLARLFGQGVSLNKVDQ
jgi:ribulose-5-phosphate 4-epimerase/fuculose-1-phosphate aldolase